MESQVFSTIIGIAAGVLGTTASFPQLIKSCKTGKTDDLHKGSICLRAASSINWTAYGVLKSDWILCGSGIVVIIIECSLLWLTFKPSPSIDPVPLRASPSGVEEMSVVV